MNCDNFHDRIFDYVYGLLDDGPAQELREHLTVCGVCQEALREAERHQNLLARAAKVNREVPLFQMPANDTAPPVPKVVTIAVPEPAPARSRSWLKIASFCTVACLMFLTGWLVIDYRAGWSETQTQLARAQAKLDSISADYAQAKREYLKKSKEIADAVTPVASLQVMGPGEIRPQVPQVFQAVVKDAKGQPLDADLDVRVLESDTKKQVWHTTLRTPGESAFSVNLAEAPGKNYELVVAAGPDRVEAPLVLGEPGYSAQLTINKSVYQTGDLLFFRALALDRYTFRPPQSVVQVRFLLKDWEQKIVRRIEGQVGTNGIAGGELALTEDLASGFYDLEVAATDGTDLTPQARKLEIVRPTAPIVARDQSGAVRAGQSVPFQVTQPNGNPLANQSVLVQQYAPGPNMASAKGTQQKLKTDARGNVQVPIEEKLQSQNVLIEVADAKSKEARQVLVPVVPTELTLEIFPEGGDLIAGIPTRIFYRVRTAAGEPAVPEGQVVIHNDQREIHRSMPGQGLGVFEWTPTLDEAVHARITEPRKEIKNLFAQLGVRPEGVVLQAQVAVVGDDEPVHFNLFRMGAPKRLFVLATCRGQVVDQRTIVANDMVTPFAMKPAVPASGLIRVTVYDADANLAPLAERLVYRVPSRRLDVAAATAGDGQLADIPAGQTRVKMTVQGKDEKKQKADFWSLVHIIDERMHNDAERSPAHHFFLAGDLDGTENLDNALVYAADNAASRASLELFLGTSGWRRFVAAPRMEMLAANGKNEKASLREATPYFSRENQPTARLLQDAEKRNEQRRAAWAQFVKIEKELNNERLAALKLVGTWNWELGTLEQRPAEYVRLAAVLFMVVLLATAVFLILCGFLRLAVRRNATFAFGGASLALLVCMIVFAGWSQFSQKDGGPGRGNPLASAAHFQPWLTFPPAAVPAREAMPFPDANGAAAPTGDFVLAAKGEKRQDRDTHFNVAQNYDAFANFTRGNSVGNMGGGGYGGNSAFEQQNFGQNRDRLAAQTNEYRARFLESARKQTDAKPPAVTATAPGGAKKDEAKNLAELSKAIKNQATDKLREFAYQWAGPNRVFQDSLLWAPAVFAQNGQAQVTFDVPQAAGRYRVLVWGHTEDGRLGFFDGAFGAGK